MVKWWSDWEKKRQGGRWEGVGFEYRGIIRALFMYSLPVVSLLFIVGSGAWVGTKEEV